MESRHPWWFVSVRVKRRDLQQKAFSRPAHSCYTIVQGSVLVQVRNRVDMYRQTADAVGLATAVPSSTLTSATKVSAAEKAAALKHEGNQLMKFKKFSAAVEKYTEVPVG